MTRRGKTVLVWFALLAIVLIALVLRDNGESEEPAYVSTEQSLGLIDEGEIYSYSFRDQGLFLETFDGDLLAVYPPVNAQVSRRLDEAGVPYVPQPPRSSVASYLPLLLLVLIVLAALIYFLRKFGGGGSMNQVIELRKTKARPVDAENKSRFADIGGNQAAIEVLRDVVDFLRAPDRWTAAGSRIPRGVLLIGPPGTGKTLLARAVAGETQSHFLYASAAEFVEMFVGVGAARMRDTFEKAAAQQPAVVFIDELEAVGRRRGSGLGTMHEEREQTLNQLLVLLDGLEQNKRLVVIAATNRPDVLDPALLRSGRFDRVLRLEPPTLSDRIEILRIHTRNKPLDNGVSLQCLAELTDGFTGADLETLTNDASLLAVRRHRDVADDDARVSVTRTDFINALEAMTKSNRQFDRLDSILVESVSQFAEPGGRAIARITLTTGSVVEGEVLWMNAQHIKLQVADGSEVIVAKELAEQIVPLAGTEIAPGEDVVPDRWAERSLGAG